MAQRTFSASADTATAMTGKSVSLRRSEAYAVWQAFFGMTTCVTISVPGPFRPKSVRLTVPPLYNSTRASKARNSVQMSEKPKRPLILPPTVAMLRNWVPTIWRTASFIAPWVKAASPSCPSSCPNVTIAPMRKTSSPSSIWSSPSPDKSMAWAMRRCGDKRSQQQPPRTTADRFCLSFHASSSDAAFVYCAIFIKNPPLQGKK